MLASTFYEEFVLESAQSVAKYFSLKQQKSHMPWDRVGLRVLCDVDHQQLYLFVLKRCASTPSFHLS